MIKRWSKNIESKRLSYRDRLMDRNPAGVEICVWRLFELLFCFHESIAEVDHVVGVVPPKARKGLVHLSDLNDRNLSERGQHALRIEIVFAAEAHDNGPDEDLCECRKRGRQYHRHKRVGRGDGHDTE